jgi:outer membrane immunogenic protein
MGDLMKAVKLALAGATFLCSAFAAQAADVYSKGESFKDGPGYGPAISWTGFYVGAHLGAALGNELTATENDAVATITDVDETIVAGIHVGYNRQLANSWVIGLEGDYSALDTDFVDQFGDKFGLTDYVASVRARLGYAFGSTLVYGTAGVGFLGFNDDVADFLDDDVAVGYVIGAGVEHKLAETVSLGVEALYNNYEADLADDSEFGIENDFVTVRARLNYHLNNTLSPLN